MYLMRWPVFRFSWLNEIFSHSDVAGYSATGQVTRDRRRKPFQLARGAIRRTPVTGLGLKTHEGLPFRHAIPSSTDSFSRIRCRAGGFLLPGA